MAEQALFGAAKATADLIMAIFNLIIKMRDLTIATLKNELQTNTKLSEEQIGKLTAKIKNLEDQNAKDKKALENGELPESTVKAVQEEIDRLKDEVKNNPDKGGYFNEKGELTGKGIQEIASRCVKRKLAEVSMQRVEQIAENAVAKSQTIDVHNGTKPLAQTHEAPTQSNPGMDLR